MFRTIHRCRRFHPQHRHPHQHRHRHHHRRHHPDHRL